MPTYLRNVGGHIHHRDVAQPRLGAEWVASSLLGSRIKIHRLNLLEPGNLAVRACRPLEEPFITPTFWEENLPPELQEAEILGGPGPQGL